MKHKNIWMCWFQGFEDQNMPTLNKKCLNRWIELNENEWNINFISFSNINNYVPEFFDIVKNKNLSLAKKSDLLRLLLLNKYGGVWVDASVYPMLPLTNFIDVILNETMFFAYRFMPRSLDNQNGHREISSWFLVSDRIENYLISELKNSFIEKINNNNCEKYFCFHETLTELIDNNYAIKNIIDNMVQINSDIPHSATKNWNFRKHSFLYKRPKLPEILL